MSYKVNSITGELSEYAFDFGGVIALRNFTVRTNGNRLIIQSAENANFSILDALVNEVEIDGVVYNNTKDAQEALQRLVFNPAIPVIMTKEERELLESLKNITQSGLMDDEIYPLTAGRWSMYPIPENAKLYAIELLGGATIQVGTESNLANLGDFTGVRGSVLQLGLVTAPYVYLHSNRNVEIIPIVYKRNKLL